MFNIDYPTLVFCYIDNRVVITSNKIGSRFFENKSGEWPEGTKYKHNLRFNSHDTRISSHRDTFPISFQYEHSHGVLENTKHFCDLVNVSNIEDIFKQLPITFITRDPWERFWSGVFEQYRGQDILEIVKKLDRNIFNDSHCSLYNLFIVELISYYEIKNYEVIDLKSPLILERYGEPLIENKDETNKPYYKPWLENEDNKVYIERLQTKLKPHMDLEIDSYKKLLNYE